MILPNLKTAKVKYINQDHPLKHFLKNKTCSYKPIPNFQAKFPNNHLQDYYDYTHSFTFENSANLISSSEPMIMTEELSVKQEDFDQILNFLEGKKANIYKNIINGFQTHIKSCKNESLMNLYESLLNHQWDFKYIQKRVQKSYKKCGRLNLKLKNLMLKNKLNKVFIYFLENFNELWLDHSKIKNKDVYKQSIDLLLKAYDYDILDDNIKVYRKQKKVQAD